MFYMLSAAILDIERTGRKKRWPACQWEEATRVFKMTPGWENFRALSYDLLPKT